MKLAEEIGEAALLEMMAEECVEAAHAALKLARLIRAENPTPASGKVVRKNLAEEIADVSICVGEIFDAGLADREESRRIRHSKKVRMRERIRMAKMTGGTAGKEGEGR